MRVVWSKPIRTSNPWEPEFFGVFCKLQNDITFFCKNNGDLIAFDAKGQEARVIYSSRTGEIQSLPRRWAVAESAGITYLLTSENQGINLETNTLTDHIPTEAQAAYRDQVRPLGFYEESVFCLDEFTIKHEGYWGYVCMKNGSPVWKFVGHAYLYTDIIRWNNRLIFGTAGNGGYFYVLDIESGKPLIALKTGGTCNFVQIGNLCYVLGNARQAQLFCIDLTDGTIVSQCSLPGKAKEDSRVTLIDRCIHAITFDYAKSWLKGAFWNCIEI